MDEFNRTISLFITIFKPVIHLYTSHLVKLVTKTKDLEKFIHLDKELNIQYVYEMLGYAVINNSLDIVKYIIAKDASILLKSEQILSDINFYEMFNNKVDVKIVDYIKTQAKLYNSIFN